MRVFVLGSGGREHALAHTFHRQGHQVWCFPGNGGTDLVCEAIDIPLSLEDHEGLGRFAMEQEIDLAVAGPEALLAAGIADTFQRAGIPFFGPTRQASIIETSKMWSKSFMDTYRIPTADFVICNNAKKAYEAASARLTSWNGVAVKPSGLTGGKGVVCCPSLEIANDVIHDLMENERYGSSTDFIVLEEMLFGKEVSLLAFCDGNTILPMIPSQDHKRIGDGDQGPNTGGIGAYAPVPFLDTPLLDEIDAQIVQPTLKGLQKENIPYCGVIYFGLMITEEGPKLLEYNCRFGDPETQAVLPLLESDLAEAMLLTAQKKLDQARFQWRGQNACCIVMTAKGYPGSPQLGDEIFGLEAFSDEEPIIPFHAGTKLTGKNFVTTGGRVVSVTALGDTIDDAVKKAYQGINRIHFEGKYYRNDIAYQAKAYQEAVC